MYILCVWLAKTPFLLPILCACFLCMSMFVVYVFFPPFDNESNSDHICMRMYVYVLMNDLTPARLIQSIHMCSCVLSIFAFFFVSNLCTYTLCMYSLFKRKSCSFFFSNMCMFSMYMFVEPVWRGRLFHAAHAPSFCLYNMCMCIVYAYLVFAYLSGFFSLYDTMGRSCLFISPVRIYIHIHIYACVLFFCRCFYKRSYMYVFICMPMFILLLRVAILCMRMCVCCAVCLYFAICMLLFMCILLCMFTLSCVCVIVYALLCICVTHSYLLCVVYIRLCWCSVYTHAHMRLCCLCFACLLFMYITSVLCAYMCLLFMLIIYTFMHISTCVCVFRMLLCIC